MKEQDLVDKIKAYLSKQPNTFHWKEHGGVYGTAGIPDIIVCYKGKFVGLECKAKGRKPTVLQQITINKIKPEVIQTELRKRYTFLYMSFTILSTKTKRKATFGNVLSTNSFRRFRFSS